MYVYACVYICKYVYSYVYAYIYTCMRSTKKIIVFIDNNIVLRWSEGPKMSVLGRGLTSVPSREIKKKVLGYNEVATMIVRSKYCSELIFFQEGL